MRTPGRCSNIEGCWISASQRDVWLTVGEDFTCPNCGGALSPPPGRSVSMIGLKRVVVTGAAATMAVAALAAVTVRLSKPPLHTRATIVALMHGAGTMPASHPPVRPVPGQAARPQAAELASAAPVAPSVPAPPVMASAPVAPRPGLPAPAPVPFYTAPSDPAPAQPVTTRSVASAIAQGGTMQTGKAVPAADRAENDVPAAFVTLISQATFVPSPSGERPLILPISFGAPLAPETDAAPVDSHWRHHGMVRRRSYFLPAPGQDDTRAFCPSPAPLP